MQLFPSDGAEECVSINYKSGRNGQPILEVGKRSLSPTRLTLNVGSPIQVMMMDQHVCNCEYAHWKG